ncbi:MAG: hypothetical protein HYY93_06710 [Planctomycetes bacterium]|nr:hypothetical protein [Planctomycetota bacterium]
MMVNVTLSNELDEFLQSVGNRARKSGGYKLPKTLILRGLARVLRELVEADRIDLAGLKTEEEFVKALRTGMGLGGSR